MVTVRSRGGGPIRPREFRELGRRQLGEAAGGEHIELQGKNTKERRGSGKALPKSGSRGRIDGSGSAHSGKTHVV